MLYACFQKIFRKKFLIFALRILLTVAMPTLVRNAIDNQGGTTFTLNRQSTPPQNTKMTVDETRRLDNIRRLCHVYYSCFLVSKCLFSHRLIYHL
jgi:hypothetical protein